MDGVDWNCPATGKVLDVYFVVQSVNLKVSRTWAGGCRVHCLQEMGLEEGVSAIGTAGAVPSWYLPGLARNPQGKKTELKGNLIAAVILGQHSATTLMSIASEGAPGMKIVDFRDPKTSD